MDVENKSRVNAEQFKHFYNTEYIEKSSYPVLVKKTIYTIVTLVLVFLIWSILTTINEVAVSYGEVAPLEDAHIIQHVQGGTIRKIYVKNGDEVERGQPLIKLDPDAMQSELQKAQSKELSLLVNAARLRAFIQKKPETAVDWESIVTQHPYNSSENNLLIQKTIKEDSDLLKQQNQERQNQSTIFHEKLQQKQAELKQFVDSKSEVEKKLVLFQKEEAMYRSVVDKGYVSKRDYLEAQRKTIETTSQLKQVIAKIDSAKSAILEAQEELTKLDAVLNKASLEKLNEINAELLIVRHTIQLIVDQKKKLLIRAPITGIVKGLEASIGSVISPAASVMEIIPTRGTMIVQCKISTKDIGHIKIGDPVQVKVLAYDFSRYGVVPGKVMEISASTFTTEKGLPYYKGKISLEKNYIGDNPKHNRLIPGMTVEANIIIGKRSVFSFLLRPITRGLQTAFREP